MRISLRQSTHGAIDSEPLIKLLDDDQTAIIVKEGLNIHFIHKVN